MFEVDYVVVAAAAVVVLRGQTANLRDAFHELANFYDRTTPAAVWQCLN